MFPLSTKKHGFQFFTMDLCFFSHPFFRGFSIGFLMSVRPDPAPPSPGITLLDLADSQKVKKTNRLIRRCSSSALFCGGLALMLVLTVDIYVKAPQHSGPRRKQPDLSFLFSLLRASYNCSTITDITNPETSENNTGWNCARAEGQGKGQRKAGTEVLRRSSRGGKGHLNNST